MRLLAFFLLNAGGWLSRVITFLKVTVIFWLRRVLRRLLHPNWHLPFPGLLEESGSFPSLGILFLATAPC